MRYTIQIYTKNFHWFAIGVKILKNLIKRRFIFPIPNCAINLPKKLYFTKVNYKTASMEDDHQFYFLSPSPTTEESFSSYSPFAQKSDAAFIDCKQFKLLDVQPIISDELLMQLSTRELNRKLAVS